MLTTLIKDAVKHKNGKPPLCLEWIDTAFVIDSVSVHINRQEDYAGNGNKKYQSPSV
jgi:hypothetical protein